MSASDLPEGCLFYHTIDLPGLGTVPGVWDHRDTAEPYLGRIDFAGKRVLEVGPANGFFSFELERRGARVVSLELGEDSDWDRVPHPFVTEALLRDALRRNVAAIRKAWLFAHERLGSKVDSVRGTVYDAPRLVDRVDVSFFGNVLQHLRDPLLALTRVAEVTAETLIVSESLWIDTPEFRESPQMILIPRVDSPEVSHSFWNVSPALVVEVARLLGFAHTRIELHDQTFNDPGDSARSRSVPHFTVTARRVPAGSSLPSTRIAFESDWYDDERHERHARRWSKDRVARVVLRCAAPATVTIALGVKSATRGDDVSVSVNGRELWRRVTLDICAVTLADVPLVEGENVVELETSGPVNTTLSPTRPLGLMLVDFGVAPA